MSQQTNYLGRGDIGGHGLVVDRYATLRGKSRRLDPDGSNGNVPYFAGLEIGGTLIVSASGTVTTVNITGPSIATVLSELNAALMPNARAFDDGGCIAIQVTAAGDNGFLEIRGGSAASPLGFDMAFGNILSWAGAVTSGPEGLVGNSEMSAFICLGESVSSKSVNRALTRIASNSDILNASQRTPTLKIDRIGSLTSGQQTVSGNYGIVTISSLGADVPDLYTGYDRLAADSTADDLSPFFFLLDNANGQLSTCRVVGVGVNAVAGAPPYADAMSVSDAGNVLGNSLRRTDPITIIDIPEGSLVRAAAGSFAAVRVGDLAYIEEAANTNKVPWSNTMEPWVVERKGTEPTGLYDQVQLRPLSLAERTLLGYASYLAARTSLNTHIESGEDYGTIRFETGSFVNADIVRIIVSPPITAGHSLRLFAAVRSNGVEYQLGDEAASLAPISQALIQEFARAVAAEATLATSVTTERNRALAAEAAELARAQGVESALAAADLSPSQKSTLTSGGNADALHTHSNNGAAVNHTHTEDQIVNLVGDLANRSMVGHGHAQAEISGLVGALAAKSNVGHGHGVADISGMATPWGVLTGGAASNADAYHTHAVGGGLKAGSRITLGTAYGSVETQGTGWAGDYIYGTNLWTGPIGMGVNGADPILEIIFEVFGFTHTSQDGDIWARVYVSPTTLADPTTALSRSASCSSGYSGLSPIYQTSAYDKQDGVPDDNKWWRTSFRYQIVVSNPAERASGLYISPFVRTNNQILLSGGEGLSSQGYGMHCFAQVR